MNQFMSRIVCFSPVTDQPVTVGELIEAAAAALLFWALIVLALWAVM